MTDRVEEAIGLLIQQYKAKPNIASLIGALTSPMNEIEGVSNDLLLKRLLDTAEGAQLDVIGKIVVLDRPFIDTAIDDTFQLSSVFDMDSAFDPIIDNFKGLSSLTRPDLGGRLLQFETGSLSLADDELYRRYLKAKIIRNNTDGTIPTLIRYFNFVFDATVTISNHVGFIVVTINKAVSFRETELATTAVPVAAGVRVDAIYFAPGLGPFGFAGNDVNSGFGQYGQPQTGAGFSSVV
jgi:hypothetical protein